MNATPLLGPCVGEPSLVAASPFPTRARAEQAARDFEALFLRQIIGDMRRNAETFGEGLFGESGGAQIKEGWFDSMLADRMAATGRVGLADSLLADFERHGWAPAADESASAAGDESRQDAPAAPGLATLSTRPDPTTLPTGRDLAALPVGHELATLAAPAVAPGLATLPTMQPRSALSNLATDDGDQ